MFVLALGLTLNTKTGLGVSPIVSVAYCVSQILGLNFGDMTFVLYALFVAAQFAIRGKKSHLYDLLQFPLSLVFSRVLNLFDWCIPYDSAAHGFFSNFLLLIVAILCTGIGVSMTVNMRLVPNPGDGIVAAVAEKMGRDQGFAKNIFDVGCVTVTCIIGLAARGEVIGIGVGTLAAMVGVGRSIALVNHFFKDRMCRAAAASTQGQRRDLLWHTGLWPMRSGPRPWMRWWGRSISWGRMGCCAGSLKAATCLT